MRLRLILLTSALTIAVAAPVNVPAVASARVVHQRTTSVTLTAEHSTGGAVDLIAHTTWRHKLADGHVRSGHTAGLRLEFQTYLDGLWIRIYRIVRSKADGSCVIQGFPDGKARYRVLLKKTVIGDYAYRGSKSKSIRA